MKKIKPTLRGEHYHIRRRVPTRYKHVDTREYIQISLFTDSLKLAEDKAQTIWREMIEAWEAKLEGRHDDAEARIAAAMNLAQRRGYAYLPIEKIVAQPIQHILKRTEAVIDSRGRLDLQEADAVLGVMSPPRVAVSKSLDEFYRLAKDRTVGKNDDQMRRHRAPRAKAIANWVKVNGDQDLGAITTDDWFTFRSWWADRVADGNVMAASANKDFTYLNAMWKVVARAKSIKLLYSMDGVPLSEAKTKKRTRLPFSDAWISDKLLAPGALDGLNDDARYILLALINTGARPSEIAGLMADDIKLDARVPHILIQPNANRALKNAHSERYIPLTGISLEAIKAMKGGFPRYAANSATLSATVNKFLTENKLLESPDHSMYGLRHAFEDRLLVGGIDERVRRDLMGHGLKREKYGLGGDMAFVRDLLLPLAL